MYATEKNERETVDNSMLSAKEVVCEDCEGSPGCVAEESLMMHEILGTGIAKDAARTHLISTGYRAYKSR